MNHSSRKIGKVLSVFLGLTIILNVVALINVYFYIYQDSIFQNIMVFDQVIGFVLFGLNIILMILYSTWIYKVHSDLNKISLHYPISPIRAILRIGIPFYNIWGTWNVYSTLADHFETKDVTKPLAKKIDFYLPLFYITFFFLWTSNELLNYKPADIVWIFAYTVHLLLTITYLIIVRTITRSFQIIGSTDVESEVTFDREKLNPIEEPLT